MIHTYIHAGRYPILQGDKQAVIQAVIHAGSILIQASSHISRQAKLDTDRQAGTLEVIHSTSHKGSHIIRCTGRYRDKQTYGKARR